MFEDNDESKQRFETLFHGLIVYGNQNTTKGLSVLSREIGLLDKLESISKPCECGKTIGNEPDRELIFPAEITINDSEFDMLYDYISKVPWSIGKPARIALKTLEWLKGASNGSAPV
jgi:hypothetical protein